MLEFREFYKKGGVGIKYSIIKIVVFWICIICIVLGLTFTTKQKTITEKTIKNKTEKIIQLEKENLNLLEKLEEYEKWQKEKDDRIVELEEELEKFKTERSLSIPNIDSSKKTYMDYCMISRGSKSNYYIKNIEKITFYT